MKRNTVAVIYDDSRPTGTEVQSITGKVSYGDTILKRRSLRERTEDILKELEHFGGFYPADSISEQVAPMALHAFQSKFSCGPTGMASGLCCP